MSNRWRPAQRMPDEVTFDGLDERFADRVSAAGANGEQQLLARLGATPDIHRALERPPEGVPGGRTISGLVTGIPAGANGLAAR
jgi:hypothetical protein